MTCSRAVACLKPPRGVSVSFCESQREVQGGGILCPLISCAQFVRETTHLQCVLFAKNCSRRSMSEPRLRKEATLFCDTKIELPGRNELSHGKLINKQLF